MYGLSASDALRRIRPQSEDGHEPPEEENERVSGLRSVRLGEPQEGSGREFLDVGKIAASAGSLQKHFSHEPGAPEPLELFPKTRIASSYIEIRELPEIPDRVEIDESPPLRVGRSDGPEPASGSPEDEDIQESVFSREETHYPVASRNFTRPENDALVYLVS